ERGVTDTLVVRWEGNEFLPVGETEGNNLSDNEAIALKHLAKMCVSDPAPIPPGFGQLAGLKGARLEGWQSRVMRGIWNNVNQKSLAEMLKLQRGLQRKDRIDTDGVIVWQT